MSKIDEWASNPVIKYWRPDIAKKLNLTKELIRELKIEHHHGWQEFYYYIAETEKGSDLSLIEYYDLTRFCLYDIRNHSTKNFSELDQEYQELWKKIFKGYNENKLTSEKLVK